MLCKIIGHKIDKRFTDSGYVICQRCGAHEYYDHDKYNRWSLVSKIEYIIYKLKEKMINILYKPNKELPF